VTQAFTEVTTYMAFHDHERMLTFRWDGISDQIEVHSGGLSKPQMELIPLPHINSVLDRDTAIGWLIWFQHACQSWIRIKGEFENRKELHERDPDPEA